MANRGRPSQAPWRTGDAIDVLAEVNLPMDAYERFHQLLKRDFLPLLRADGFKGSGNTFRRVKGDRIDVVNVQGSRHGGKCCVNGERTR